VPLSSANSINLGRLLPQSFYYIWSWSRNSGKPVTFCVPCGNFGNLTAGLYAHACGLPAEGFIAATNANDVVPEYLSSGIYTPRPSTPTYSNAMDVGAPSNFERMMVLYRNEVGNFRKEITGMTVSDEQTLETMGRIYQNYRYLACPHTAVGLLSAERFLETNPGRNIMVLSTAHPGKFVETVKKATGQNPKLPAALESLLHKEKDSIILNNTYSDLREYILSRYL
jgi:threonine synthase